MPVVPPREIRPLGIFVGVALLWAGLAALLLWLPALERQGSGPFGWGNDWDALALQTAGWMLVLLGATSLVVGSLRLGSRLAFCRKCDRQVVARRRWFGFRCERCASVV